MAEEKTAHGLWKNYAETALITKVVFLEKKHEPIPVTVMVAVPAVLLLAYEYVKSVFSVSTLPVLAVTVGFGVIFDPVTVGSATLTLKAL